MCRSVVATALCALALAALLPACPKPPPPPVSDAGPADAGPPDAGPPLVLTAVTLLPDGGEEPLSLVAGGHPVIAPAGGFRVHASEGVANYRIRVFDEADRVLPSDDRAYPEAGGLSYELRFPVPLRPGHRYALLIDAQTGTAFTDAAGKEQPDLRVPFSTRGERERSPKTPSKRRRK